MECIKKWFVALSAILVLTGCTVQNPVVIPSETPTQVPGETASAQPEATIDEDGIYDTEEEVCLYLQTYWHLPENYMSKKEARKQGWEGGALNQVIDGMCIGGDVFGNHEGILPEVKGRTYYECDIDTLHSKSRGAKRIIWSTDETIYYTEDHYESFELIYGEE